MLPAQTMSTTVYRARLQVLCFLANLTLAVYGQVQQGQRRVPGHVSATAFGSRAVRQCTVPSPYDDASSSPVLECMAGLPIDSVLAQGHKLELGGERRATVPRQLLTTPLLVVEVLHPCDDYRAGCRRST